MAVSAVESALSLPFDDAISFFAGKAGVTTKAWTDVWQEAHTRSFMVAGAAKQALVDDFQKAIRKAIEKGTTLERFRKDFDKIVAKHGWTGWKGEGSAAGHAWRTRIIYETNLNMAYSAGRYAEMSDPDVLRVYPYWMYRHSGNPHPRLQHKAWDGLTLEATDPWWSTNWPPNGWGCGCTVEPISARGLVRQGKTGPDRAPPLDLEPKTIGKTGRVEMVPKGVDPGFAYNPGLAWKGAVTPPHDAVMRAAPGWTPPPPAPPAPKLSPRAAAAGPEPPIGDLEKWIEWKRKQIDLPNNVTMPPPDDPSWTEPLTLGRPPTPAAPASTPLAARVLDHQLAIAQADWARGLSDTERATIAAYKGDWAKLVNPALRRAKGAVPKVHAEAVATLDAAIARARVPQELTVFRGIKNARFLRGAKVGDVVSDAGYTSTSVRRRTAKDFHGDALLVIDVPKDYPAAYVNRLRPLQSKPQYELLIGRGARFEVVEIGDRTWRLKLLP